MNVFEIFGKIFIDDNGASKSLDGVEKKGKSVASSLGNGITKAAKWGSAIAIGAGVALGGIVALANKTSDYAGDIDDLSKRTGINVEELQKWKYAVEQSGGNVDKLEVGIKKLSDTMVGAMEGNADTSESFAKLGISVDDLKDKSQEEIFNQVITGLADMEAGAERNALGNDLLGKSYTELLPMLEEGSSGINDLKNKASELGLVMSQEAVSAGEQFGDTMDTLKSSFMAIVMQLGSSFMPILQEIANFLIANMPVIQGVLESVFSNFIPMVTQLADLILPALIGLFDNMTNGTFPSFTELLMGLITSVLPVLIDLFNVFVTDVLPILIDLFSFIITDILPPVMALFQVLIDTVLPPLLDLFKLLVTELLPPIIDLFKEIITAVLPLLIDVVTTVVEAFAPLIDVIIQLIKFLLPPLIAIFKVLANIFVENLKTAIDTISIVLDNLKVIFENIMDFIKNVFTGNWKGAWDNIKNIFKGIFDSFEAVVKAPINAVIGLINKAIGAINGLKIDVPDWLTDLTGMKDFSFHIPKIPLLAKGGNVTGRGSFISGEAGAELVTMTGNGVTVTPLTNSQNAIGKDSVKEINLNLKLNIENFNNTSNKDIEELVEELAFQTKRKLEGKGGFAYA